MPEDINTTIEVDGPGAQQITDSIVSTLGLNPDDINGANISITAANGTDTTFDLECSGPLSGDFILGMVGAYDWSDVDVQQVSVEVWGESEADEPRQDGGDDDGDDGSKASISSFTPRVSPLVDKVDPDVCEFPGGEPQRIQQNSQPHIGAWLLSEHRDVTDSEWMSAETLADYAGENMSHNGASSALSRLFLDARLAVRRRSSGGSGVKYEYAMTKQLQEELARLGKPDGVKAVEA